MGRMTGKVDAKLIARISIFSSLTFLLSLIELPYPLLPFLKFNIGEIPILVFFLAFKNIYATVILAVVQALGLLVIATYPIGILFKFLAVTSMILGFYIALKGDGKNSIKLLKLGLLYSVFFRVAIMTLTNFTFLYFFAPGFLKNAVNYVSGYLKFMPKGILGQLTIILLLTAIFNAIHTVIDYLISHPIANIILRFMKHFK